MRRHGVLFLLVAFLSFSEAAVSGQPNEHHGRIARRQSFLDQLLDTLGVGNGGNQENNGSNRGNDDNRNNDRNGNRGGNRNEVTVTETRTVRVTASALGRGSFNASGVTTTKTVTETVSAAGAGAAKTVTLTMMVMQSCANGPARSSAAGSPAQGAVQNGEAGRPGSPTSSFNGVGGVRTMSISQTATTTITRAPEPPAQAPVASAPAASVPAAVTPPAAAPPIAEPASSLQPLQPAPSSSLAQLQPLQPSSASASLAPLPAAPTSPAVAPAPPAAAPANPAQSVNLGGLNGQAGAGAPPAAEITAPVAAAPIQPQIDVSGLTLSSVLQLGNLLQQTVQLQARATAAA